MRILNLLKIAWRAIKLNKMRTFLTMLGIIIGVASVIAMLAVGEGSTQSIKTQISSMYSNLIKFIFLVSSGSLYFQPSVFYKSNDLLTMSTNEKIKKKKHSRMDKTRR